MTILKKSVEQAPGLNQYEEHLSVNGAAHIIGGALALGPVYTDSTYNYYGEAVPGTALTAAAWRVSRETITNNYIQWADGNGNFDNVFTDLATVAAMTFS